MKSKKNGLVRGLVLLAALLTASTAVAGYRWNYPVTIDLASSTVTGSLGSTRNSANGTEWIGCGVTAQPTKLYAICYAQDAAGGRASCYADGATSPSMVSTIAALNGDGFVSFSWDANGNCTKVLVSARSYWDPKAP